MKFTLAAVFAATIGMAMAGTIDVRASGDIAGKCVIQKGISKCQTSQGLFVCSDRNFIHCRQNGSGCSVNPKTRNTKCL